MSKIRPISKSHSALIGLWLAGALTVVGVHVADPAASAQPDAAPTNGCVVADDQALRAGVAVAPEAHHPHEEWLATGHGPAAARALGAELAARFGADTEQSPYTTLRRGLIGATVDHYSRQLVVVVDPAIVPVTGLNAEIASRLGAAGVGDVGLRVQAGCRSSASLLAAVGVLTERSWGPSAKSASFGFYVEPRTSTVDVTFGPADGAAADAVRQQLGEAVTVSIGNPGRRDRMTDGEPHWGGAAIGYLNNRFCSAGFVIRRNIDNVRGGVSAGHCFTNGDSVYSGSEFWGGANGEFGYPTFDMIRINSTTETYANVIHTDPCCPSSRTVTGRADPVIDELVCASGYVTRAVCGVRVTSLNGSLCDQDGCTTNLMVASKPGSVVGAGGDSGAPVYVRPTTTTAHVRGMEVGGTAPDNFYAERITRIESHLGVTVATS